MNAKAPVSLPSAPHAPDRKSMSCETFGQNGASHALTEVVGGVAAAGAATGMVAAGAFFIAVSPTEGGLSLPAGVVAIGLSVPAAMDTWSGVVDQPKIYSEEHYYDTQSNQGRIKTTSAPDPNRPVSPTEKFIQKGLSGACKLVAHLTP